MSVSGSRPPIKVAIVAPVYNRRDTTLQFLTSLARINRAGLDVRIIVVDDNSSDGTGQAIREQFPDVTVLRGTGNLWYSGGINFGLKHALNTDPDYVLIINDDTVHDANFLRFLVECAETNGRAVVGGLLLLWNEPHRVFQVAPRWDTLYGGWRQLQQQTVWTVPNKPFQVEAISGNCVLVPVAAIREGGLMNERWFPHYGDAEYTPRLKKLGWRLLIEPRARVFNEPNRIATPMSKMSAGELYRVLWANLHSQQNLRGRFAANWLSAPTKAQAVAACAAWIVRLGLNRFGAERNRWFGEFKEKKLSDEHL